MERFEHNGEPHNDGATRSVPQLVDAALGGRPTVLLLLGRNGDDVHSVIDTLVRPVAAARGVRDADVLEVTGLSWEQGLEFGILDRLGFDRDEPAKSLMKLASSPTVILITEAADADSASLRALSSAVHRLHDQPLLVLMAGTVDDPTQEDQAPLSEIRRAHRRTTSIVEALDAHGVREFVSRMGVALDEGVARRLARHTDGSPSAIAELLAHHDPAAWKAPDFQLPPTRSALARMRATLAATTPDVAALVEACAIIGRWVPIEEVGEVAGLAEPLAVLDAAIEQNLLRVRRASLRLLVGFPSRMARAAAYESMGVARQRLLHERAATLMSDEGLALRQKSMAAGGPDEEVAALIDAYAEKCAADGVWDTAGEAWLAASRLSVTPSDQTRRLVACVDAKVSAGNLYDALALIPELERTEVSAQRDGVLGYHQLLLGHRDEADMLLKRAWAGAQHLEDRDTGAVIAHRLALHALVDWNSEGLVHWCEAAMADPESVPGLEALTMLGLGLGGCGRVEEALQVCAEATGRMRTGAQGQRALMGQGWLHLALDRVPLAAHELETAAPTSTWRGSSRISLWSNAWLAQARIALGDLRAAQSAVDRAIPMMEESGQNIMMPLVHWAGAQIASLRGDLDTAEHHAAKASSVRTDYQSMQIAAAMARVAVAMARSDYTGVLRAFEQLRIDELYPGINEPGFWPWHDSYAIALVATGERDAADAFLRPHEERAAQRQHRSTMARLGGARGRLRFSQGDTNGGREAFETALGQISDLPLPLVRARLHFEYGQALRRIGKRRDAEAELYRARRGFAAMGATGYVDRCNRELKAGSRTRDADSLTDLTPQEQAVVDLVLQGMTNREVAATLFISVKTVQYHLTRVYSRLGVRSRAELAALRMNN
ncbi:helix-turn-helix transcriptional regulator [Granulicoccus sp. GXG6511]|uniref:helix-turn-helix transcriptional regulator n=1 Tax=Granulicoccus sp. GXG6511 TaxID=3381351 RepID=UPI003D7C5D59